MSAPLGGLWTVCHHAGTEFEETAASPATDLHGEVEKSLASEDAVT